MSRTNKFPWSTILSIFWAIHVLAPIIVICLFCVYSTPLIATWLDISLFQIVVYMAFVKSHWSHGMKLGNVAFLIMWKNIPLCQRIYFPIINIYHIIIWVTWMEHIWNVPILFTLTHSHSCSPTHRIVSLEIHVQIPSSF